MRKIWIFIFSLLASPFLFGQQADSLTLSFCYQRVVDYYPLAKQKQMLDEASGIKVENLNKNYLPQFNMNGRVSYQSEVTELPINIPNVSIPEMHNDMYNISLELSQLIYDGGATNTLKKIEDAGLEVEQQAVEVELYKVKERVNAMYFRIPALRASEKLFTLTKEIIEEKRDDLMSGIRNGLILPSNADVLKAEILQIDQNLVEIRTEIEAAYKMLGELINMEIPVSTKLILPQPVIETDRFDNQRPEYLLMNLQQNKILVSKNLISSQYLPKLSGFGSVGYGRPGLNMLSRDFDSYYMIGLGLKWDLINWNKQKNEKKIIDIQNNLVEARKETFDKNLKIQLENDIAKIKKYEEVIRQDQDIIDLRIKIVKTKSSQLDNGIITSTEYLEELTSASRAKLNEELHKIQLVFAKVNYLKTLGKL